MGMYTELYLGVELKKDTREDIIQWLEAHKDDSISIYVLMALAPIELKNTRLNVLSGSSYYFDAQPHFNFKYDNISRSYFLTLGLNIKNYDNDIKIFLDMIRPYITTIGHIGHTRYEENEEPTILYNYY